MIVQSMVKSQANFQSYKRCYLLESLQVFIYFRNKIILKNQTLIMDELCQKEYQDLLIIMKNRKHQKKISDSTRNYKDQIDMRKTVIF